MLFELGDQLLAVVLGLLNDKRDLVSLSLTCKKLRDRIALRVAASCLSDAKSYNWVWDDTKLLRLKGQWNLSLDSITFAYDHRYAVGLLYLSAFDPARSVADSALLLLLLSLSLSPCVCLSRPSALCQANGVVARFLAESEEVRNKEGFIKIYRRYHPTGKKNRKDEGAKDEDFLLRTIEAETSKPATKIRGLNASASPYLPSKRGSRPEAESGAAQQTAEDPPAAPYSIDCSNRVLLLFDLNGTLINKTNRRKNNLKSLKVRPGAEALLRLRDKGFKLGIYSSATLKTCTKAIKSLADAMGGEEVFSHVLHRDYCELAPGVAGKPWDTVKPLAKHVTDVNRCILFDDDEYKVLDSESLHHVLVPEWTGDWKDGVLGALVASTEARILSSEEEDVRMAAAKISLDLLEHEERAKGGKEGSERDSPRTSAATDLGNLSLSSP